MKHTADLPNASANEFIYTKAGTCITTRWRKMGWVPASEQPEIVAKWKHYQSLATRTLDSATDSVEHLDKLSA